MVTGRRVPALLVAATVVGSAALGAQSAEGDQFEKAGVGHIARGIAEPALRALIAEVLERNPKLASAEARARAAGYRVTQARALPEPTASLTGFLAPPETRTGPQELAVGLSQALPWRGKLALAERGAREGAAAVQAEADAVRLDLVTEARRLFHELQYLDRRRMIGRELRDHLSQHEEIARARYSTGAGHGQDVVKLHAEITLAEKDLLEIQRRRIGLEARVNALRDRSALTPVLAEASNPIQEMAEIRVDLGSLIDRALQERPGLLAAEARVRQASSRTELSEMSRRPGFRVGLTYTVVGARKDAAGRLQPPEGNGDDIIALSGGITLPVWRRSLNAEVAEALDHEADAEQSLRSERAAVAARIGDLAQRLELDWRQLRLIADLLVVQAEESEESALAGYIAGTLNALELLDAEHVRFEAHTALARAEADYLIGIAELEGAIGAPLEAGMEALRP